MEYSLEGKHCIMGLCLQNAQHSNIVSQKAEQDWIYYKLLPSSAVLRKVTKSVPLGKSASSFHFLPLLDSHISEEIEMQISVAVSSEA